MPMNYDIKGKVIALCGAGSSLGYQASLLLAAQGAKLSIADSNEDDLMDKVSKIEEASTGRLLYAVVDVRNYLAVEAWLEDTVEKFGKLDGAVNLAGVVPRGMGREGVEHQDIGDWKFVLDVNLNGVLIKLMNNHGSIVNAASIYGLIGAPRNAAYVASKHAVIGLSRTAAKEVGDRGIRVNCIAPGLVEGPMANAGGQVAQNQLMRLGTPSEVAHLIAWLLCPESRFITGTVQVIDGGQLC